MNLLNLNLKEIRVPAPSRDELVWQVGLVSALVCMGASLIFRFAFGAPFLPEMMTEFIFASVPIGVVEFAVGMLGAFAKHFAFIGCVALVVLVLSALGVVLLRRWKVRGPAVVVAWCVLPWAAASLFSLGVFGTGFRGLHLRHGTLATLSWFLLIFLVYSLSLAFLEKLYLSDMQDRAWIKRLRSESLDRRRVMTGIGYAMIAAAFYDVIARPLWTWWKQSGAGMVKGGNGIFPNIDGLAREITPTAEFYQVSKNAIDPDIAVKPWRLEVSGLVESPFSISYEELRQLSAVEEFATLECISNTVGGQLIDNATWRGVRLKDLIEKARIRPGVVKIVIHAADNYADSIPLGKALQDGVLLAYEMNGAPLTLTHGFPLRLIVPGIYGMKNVKWISRIEAVNDDFKGYWQARGWDDRAEYKTMSRIDVPKKRTQKDTTIAGIAFAGDRGISKVEVSIDNGKSWMPAELRSALSPLTWVLWHMEWRALQPAEYPLVVRATDGKGIVQTADEEPPIPDGASGFHRRTVKVE